LKDKDAAHTHRFLIRRRMRVVSDVSLLAGSSMRMCAYECAALYVIVLGRDGLDLVGVRAKYAFSPLSSTGKTDRAWAEFGSACGLVRSVGIGLVARFSRLSTGRKMATSAGLSTVSGRIVPRYEMTLKWARS
jgi:hypothetical protein